MTRNILNNINIITIAMIFSLGIGIAYAWTNPTDAPTGGNIETPINTGIAGQTKNGNLIIANEGGQPNGLIVLNGNVGIATTSPAYKLTVVGDVSATGAFLYSSDINLKKNITPLIGSQLDKVISLQGVSYDWKDTNTHDIGFIAQEVEKVFPDVVHTSKITNLKSIDYPKLTVYLVEAIKEQQKQIEELKLNR